MLLLPQGSGVDVAVSLDDAHGLEYDTGQRYSVCQYCCQTFVRGLKFPATPFREPLGLVFV